MTNYEKLIEMGINIDKTRCPEQILEIVCDGECETCNWYDKEYTKFQLRNEVVN